DAPDTRSGAMYAGVPITIPVLVTGTDPATCAIPKSVIFTWPSAAISRLAGLMSRCTSAAACAACRPDATCSTTSMVSAGPSGPAARRTASDGPSTSSITRNIFGHTDDQTGFLSFVRPQDGDAKGRSPLNMGWLLKDGRFVRLDKTK